LDAKACEHQTVFFKFVTVIVPGGVNQEESVTQQNIQQ
jgi:hypothetical protein